MYNLFIVVFILPILLYNLSLSKLKLLLQEFYCTLCFVCSFLLLFFHEFHLSPMTFILYSIYLNSFHPLTFRLNPFFCINQVFIKLITMIDIVNYINMFRDNMNSWKKEEEKWIIGLSGLVDSIMTLQMCTCSNPWNLWIC